MSSHLVLALQEEITWDIRPIFSRNDVLIAALIVLGIFLWARIRRRKT